MGFHENYPKSAVTIKLNSPHKKLFRSKSRP